MDHRHQCLGQGSDAHLPLPDFPGEPGDDANPPIQSGSVSAVQLDGVQPRRSDQRQPGQRFRVDAIGFCMPGQEAPQISSLRGGNPNNSMPPPTEKYRDGQPHGSGRFDDDSKPGVP
jgi:hypothetical protein